MIDRASHRLLCLGAVCGALGASVAARPAAAQPNAVSSAVVRGTAFDSISRRPLSDAFVTLDGTRSTTTDAHGRFHFDSVAMGEHVVALQHTALDSLGLTGATTRATVGAAGADVRVATPSFATLWRAACGERPAPRDSGFVYGRVVDGVTSEPLVGATVGLTWLDLGVDRRRQINMQQFAGAAQSGPRGAYAICGVPVGVGVRMQVGADSGETPVIDLGPTDLPVRRRDFAVPHTRGTIAVRRGIIAGRVTDVGGQPLPNARIIVDDAPELRTDSAGRFVVRDVLPGSRQIEAMAIGMSPESAVITVAPGDTATFIAQLRRVTTLDVMRVTASARGRRNALAIDERVRSGLGYVRDSSTIARNGLLSTTFDQFPATMVRRGPGTRFMLLMKDPANNWCPARVLLDGVESDTEIVQDLRTEDIAVIEAFPHGASVPAELTSVQRKGRCGTAVVWTKRAFK